MDGTAAAVAALNAEEFCEVLAAALGAAGVLARKRWRMNIQAMSFLGEMKSASFRTRASAAADADAGDRRTA